jgi:predicted PurR-regulated permease PerM
MNVLWFIAVVFICLVIIFIPIVLIIIFTINSESELINPIDSWIKIQNDSNKQLKEKLKVGK